MRKLLWIGWGTALVGCVVGLWYLLASWPATNYYPVEKTTAQSPAQKAKEEGDSEPSDVVEPLIVDGGVAASAPKPPTPDAPMPRVPLTPGMKQAPRPDRETGENLRMPYADEKVVPAFGIGSGPLRIEIVGEENAFTELVEPKEPEPPVVDPHDQHCPYPGRCPAPYPYRTPPR